MGRTFLSGSDLVHRAEVLLEPCSELRVRFIEQRASPTSLRRWQPCRSIRGASPDRMLSAPQINALHTIAQGTEDARWRCEKLANLALVVSLFVVADAAAITAPQQSDADKGDYWEVTARAVWASVIFALLTFSLGSFFLNQTAPEWLHRMLLAVEGRPVDGPVLLMCVSVHQCMFWHSVDK